MLILLLVGVLAALSVNVAENLEAKNIRNGFEFLFGRAGFDIGEKLLPFTSADQLWRAFLIGLLNTLHVSVLSILTATVLGIVVGVMRISRHPGLRFLGAAHVEVYRNVPLLVLLLAIYLTITELLPGVRDAWSLGGWIYLSKTGLLYAVPQLGGWAMAAFALVGAAAGFRGLEGDASPPTGAHRRVAAAGAFVLAGFAAWLTMGFAFGWDAPVATRFSMRGGAAVTPESLSPSGWGSRCSRRPPSRKSSAPGSPPCARVSGTRAGAGVDAP